jgi:hypothetical protein
MTRLYVANRFVANRFVANPVLFAACTLILGVSGCGQTEPPSLSSGYYPMRDGSSWTYLHSKGGGWSERVTLERSGSDPNTFEQRQSGDPDGESSRSELKLVDGDVLRVTDEQRVDGAVVYSVVYDPGFIRFSAAWQDAEVGEAFTEEYERTETDVGEAPSPTQPRAHRFTVEAFSETVTVPAGTFRDCIRVRRERALDLVPDGGTFSQEEQEKLFWFAAGVGKVREENLITGSTEVLSAYEVPEE